MGERPPAPPVSFPLAVHKAGSEAKTDLRIKERRSYRFILTFMFKTPEERQVVSELVGVSSPFTYRNAAGQIVRRTHGVTVPVHLTIAAVNAKGAIEDVITDKRYETVGRESFGAESFHRLIDSVALSAGVYRVTIRVLQDVPEFAAVQSGFHIYTRYL